MVKFVNILILTAFLFACKKDKVQVPTYLEADVSFLYGDWKFIKGAFGDPGYAYPKEFFYEEDYECILNFDSSKKLTINFSNNSIVHALNLTGIVEGEDFKVVSFRNQDNQLFRFTLIPSLNLLYSEEKLFSVLSPVCFEQHELIYSNYEKI